MFKRGFVALLIVVMLFSVSSMLAQDLDKDVDHSDRIVSLEDGAPFAIFMDGQLNATDMAAPIVVFYNEQTVPVLNSDGTQLWAHDVRVWEDSLRSIDVLTVNSTGGVDLALSATVEQITEMMKASVPDQNQVIARNGATSLNYSPSGWFWVEGVYPDGKPYTFQWQAQGF